MKEDRKESKLSGSSQEEIEYLLKELEGSKIHSLVIECDSLPCALNGISVNIISQMVNLNSLRVSYASNLPTDQVCRMLENMSSL